MKSIFYGISFLALVGMTVVGCQKENLKPNLSSQLSKEVKTSEDNNRIETENQETRDDLSDDKFLMRPKKGEIACVVYDSGGNAICAGKRCGTPTGNCGRRETACECKTPSSANFRILDNGMTLSEFIKTWNDEQKRNLLIKDGFYEEDIK